MMASWPVDLVSSAGEVGWVGGGGVEEEDVLDGGAALQGMGGVGKGVLGEEVVEEDAGAGGGLLREGDGALGGGDGAFGVVGEVEGDVLGGGGGGCGDGVGVDEGGDALVRLLAAAQEEESHQQAADGEDPEEDALVAGDH